MRTAITFAKTHSGIVVFLSDNTVPVGQQREEFKALKGQRTHPDYAEVEFWESGAGCTGRIRFTDPEAKPLTAPVEKPAEPAAPAPEKPTEEKPKTPKQPSPKPR